jgi:hypothetical protein
LFCFVLFCCTGVWTQGLHLEPLHQPFFVMDFFWDRVSWTICLGWLWTSILPISPSQVARITGISEQGLKFLKFTISTIFKNTGW